MTNFALTLLAARIASPSRFGDLVLALSVAYMVMILARGLTAEPMMTKCPRLEAQQLERAEQDVLSMALLLGLIAGAGIGLCGLLPLSVTRDFGWVGLCMPAVLFQDALRYVGFSRRRPSAALASDGAWAVVQFGMLAVLAAEHATTVDWIVICWGAGAAAGAVTGAVALSIRRVGSARRWLHVASPYSLWVLPQLGISQATDQGLTLVVIAVFGTSALGGIRAIQLFVRPVFVFMLAIQALLVPSLAWRLSQHGRAGLLHETRRLAILVGALALVFASLVIVARRPLSLHLFGPSYVRYSNFVLPFAAGSVFHASSVVPSAALRALQCGRRILFVQVVSSMVAVTCVISAALLSTVYVTAWLIPSQGVVAAIAGWLALATAGGVRKAKIAPRHAPTAEQKMSPRNAPAKQQTHGIPTTALADPATTVYLAPSRRTR